MGSSQSPREVREDLLSIGAKTTAYDACKNRGIRYCLSRIEQDIQERTLSLSSMSPMYLESTSVCANE